MRFPITTNILSEVTGCSKRTAKEWCLKLKIPKLGRDYIINEKDFERLKKKIQKNPGRPKKSQEKT